MSNDVSKFFCIDTEPHSNTDEKKKYNKKSKKQKTNNKSKKQKISEDKQQEKFFRFDSLGSRNHSLLEKNNKKRVHQEIFEVDESDEAEGNGSVVKYSPALLPEYVEELNRFEEQKAKEKAKESDESSKKRACKLCKFGDGGITVNTTDVLQDIFSMHKRLFRTVPDDTIWELMCERWNESIVLPNKRGYNITIPPLTVTEAKVHFTEHDFSDIQRPLWKVILFLLRSIDRLQFNSGIWEEEVRDGVQTGTLKFNYYNYMVYDKVVTRMLKLIDFSEKITTRERQLVGGDLSSRRLSLKSRANGDVYGSKEGIFPTY